jgi:hypothetical protein
MDRQDSQPHPTTPHWIAVFAASALLFAGCETVEHGRQVAAIAGVSLATAGPPGSDRLAVEIDYDSAVRASVRSYGRPEYLHVVDRDNLFLFYTQANRVVQIERNLIPPGKVTEYAPIPGQLLKLLPQAEIERAVARLRAKKARRRAAPRAPTTRPLPAARAPAAADVSRTLNRFDLETLIDRFRKPLSAADPGVQGWRLQTLADGTRSGFARTGSLEYRIRSNSVSVTSKIGARARETPAAIRLGYYRVNRTVFGTRAHAISKQVGGLVARVAADPSGRTRVARRVAGRTIQIARDTRRGVLIYRIGTD